MLLGRHLSERLIGFSSHEFRIRVVSMLLSGLGSPNPTFLPGLPGWIDKVRGVIKDIGVQICITRVKFQRIFGEEAAL